MSWKDFTELFVRPLFTLGKTPVSLESLVEMVVVVLLVVLLSRLVRRALRTRVLAHSKLDIGLQYAIARFAGYVVLVLGFAIGLESVGVDLSTLKVVAGALGIGIGFGLQNVANDYVSGLIILAERPVQIGDRVDLGGGLVGTVQLIGVRATQVLTGDNILYIVPNSQFVTNRVVNWTHVDPRVRFSIPVSASYDSDPHLVEKLLLEVAAAIPSVLKDPAPTVVFKTFGDNALNFELRVWSTAPAEAHGGLDSQINFAIWDKFKANHIEIPFPQRDLHIKEPVEVELKQSAEANPPSGPPGRSN